jgi:hypothetical protein
MSNQQIVAAVVFAVGALWVVGMSVPKALAFVRGFRRTSVPTPDVVVAPTSMLNDIESYLTMIEQASPDATIEIRWGYAKRGLPEIEVLRAEVMRPKGTKP